MGCSYRLWKNIPPLCHALKRTDHLTICGSLEVSFPDLLDPSGSMLCKALVSDCQTPQAFGL
jgi:hypothetical protein